MSYWMVSFLPTAHGSSSSAIEVDRSHRGFGLLIETFPDSNLIFDLKTCNTLHLSLDLYEINCERMANEEEILTYENSLVILDSLDENRNDEEKGNDSEGSNEDNSDDSSENSSENSSEDSSEDSDECEESSTSNDSPPKKLQVKVVINDNVIRGFSIPQSSKGYSIIKKALSKEYNSTNHNLKLSYIDSDGDSISIVTKNDFLYVIRNYIERNIDSNLKLFASVDILRNSYDSSTTASGRPRITSTSSSISINNEIKWQKGAILGKGSFGIVYSGFDVQLCKRIAVKEMIFQDNQVNKAIQREIRILSDLEDHPNIINYLGTELFLGGIRIFMDLAESSLKSIILEYGSLAEPLIIRYISEIIMGLDFLHLKNIIHRDIKPSNILLLNNQIKLADFGCSTIINYKSDGTESGTMTLAGTTLYMAPEIMSLGMNKDKEEKTSVVTESKYDNKVDIWSVGVTLIEMSTGKLPFTSTASAIYNVCIAKAYPTLPEYMSSDAHDFLNQCLVESPERRAACVTLLKHRWLQQSIDTLNYDYNDHKNDGRPSTSTAAITFAPLMDSDIKTYSSKHNKNNPLNSTNTHLSSGFDAYFDCKPDAKDTDHKRASPDGDSYYDDDFEPEDSS